MSFIEEAHQQALWQREQFPEAWQRECFMLLVDAYLRPSQFTALTWLKEIANIQHVIAWLVDQGVPRGAIIVDGNKISIDMQMLPSPYQAF